MLSKTRWLSGLQCEKKLWIEVNDRGRVPPPDPARQAIFDQGHEVGELAQRLRPGGIEIDRRRLDWRSAVAETRSALERRVPLYEAAFAHDGAACRVDILAPSGERGWELLEVKSSTQAKPEHLDDVALQVWVARGAGIDVRSAKLVHLDSGYVRGEALELERLFTEVDLTAGVEAAQAGIDERVAALLAVTRLRGEPAVPIGPHCDAPWSCPLKPACWSGVPEESVLDLHRGGPMRWRLFGQGVRSLAEIPADVPLSAAQAIQVAAARDGRPRVDGAAIGAFLGQLEPPLHFLDFESYALAVPRFAGTRPYQQIAFQFSLFVDEGAGGPPRSVDFLAEGEDDPRPALAAALRSAVGEGPLGTFVAYNAAFEKAQLADLAAACPEQAAWLANVGSRFVDLLAPFRSFSYYHPRQRGSASLKAVLPVLGARGYDGLSIDEGGLAAREFLRSLDAGTPMDERRRIRDALLAYCRRDTEGMLEIVASLRALAESDGAAP